MAAINDFITNLNEEARLGKYLDLVYPTIDSLSDFEIERKSDKKSQNAGIDLQLTRKNRYEVIFVDEKAQLFYINKSLSTFTFEISYIYKKRFWSSWKKGWFFDEKKRTNTYFLITCIQGNDREEFTGFRLIRVNRKLLQDYLAQHELTEKKIFIYEKKFRSNEELYKGEQPIAEIPRSFGTFHCSFHLKERPINLKISLQALIDNRLGVELVPCTMKKY